MAFFHKSTLGSTCVYILRHVLLDELSGGLMGYTPSSPDVHMGHMSQFFRRSPDLVSGLEKTGIGNTTTWGCIIHKCDCDIMMGG